jgi:hypothetical protein
LEETFVEENMNKWPVIVIDFNNVRFGSQTPTNDEINKALVEHVIQPAFEQYDYLLFLEIAGKILNKKYKDTSTEAYRRLFKDLDLDKFESMKEKIDALWNYYGKKMTGPYARFYEFYIGGAFNGKYISRYLKSLADVLKDYYGKRVIFLVDGHDVEVQGLLENSTIFK